MVLEQGARRAGCVGPRGWGRKRVAAVTVRRRWVGTGQQVCWPDGNAREAQRVPEWAGMGRYSSSRGSAAVAVDCNCRKGPRTPARHVSIHTGMHGADGNAPRGREKAGHAGVGHAQQGGSGAHTRELGPAAE